MIREAREEELPRLLAIYESARFFMHRHGNPNQWRDGGPNEEMLREDLRLHRLFVGYDENGVYAVFACLTGEDETYAHIDGAWHDSRPYITLHRVASDGTHKRVLAECADFALTKGDYLRIDTHRDNRYMLAATLRFGFRVCGIIRLPDLSPRVALDYVRP